MALITALFTATLLFQSCVGFFSPDSTVNPGEAALAPIPEDFLNRHLPGGPPASLRLVSVSTSHLDVRGAGGVENSELKFFAADSEGRKAGDGYLINFHYSGPANGGSLTELSDTLRGGYAVCHFKSGTAAGVGAVTAVYLDSHLLAAASATSAPLLISGGPPVEGNFTLIPERRNLYFQMGAELKITAYAYDFYGNPARASMVYFHASAGGITSGGLTDSAGRAEAVYRITESASDSIPVILRAETWDGSGTLIAAVDSIVLSGSPVAAFVPSDTFNLPLGGVTTVGVHISDARGRPLSGGSEIIFSISGGGLLLGVSRYLLPDVLSGQTFFEVRVKDDAFAVGTLYLSAFVQSANGVLASGLWGKIQ